MSRGTVREWRVALRSTPEAGLDSRQDPVEVTPDAPVVTLLLMPEFERHPLNLTLALARTPRQDVHGLCDGPMRVILPDAGNPTAIEFFSKVLHRWCVSRIKPTPRTVHLPERLRRNPHYAKYERRITEISRILESGSTKINDPSEHFLSKDYYKPVHRDEKGNPKVKYDLLLHEWNIHHFHLGEASGVPELLYGIVLPSDVLMIDIWGHGTDLSNADILKAAKSEWSSLFNGVGLPEISGNNLTPDQIRALRKRNVGYCIDVGGIAFVPFEAFTASGTPISVRWHIDRLNAVVRELESYLTNPASETRRSLAETLNRDPQDMDLRVVDHPDNFRGMILLYDERSERGIRVNCEPLAFPWRTPPQPGV